MDGELREAVDRDVRKELQDIGPFEATLPEEGPVADVARLLPGHALVDPVRVLGQPPANGEVPLGRGPHFCDRDGHCGASFCGVSAGMATSPSSPAVVRCLPGAYLHTESA